MNYWNIQCSERLYYGEGKGEIISKESGDKVKVTEYGVGRVHGQKSMWRGSAFYQSLPILYEQQLRQLGATIHKNIGVCNLPITGVPLLTITGEIPREIDFEKGFPYQYTEDPNNERNLIPDPLVRDDQAIVINLSGKGLVVLTGCGHAGVINTIKITGINKIHAIMGGFHLPSDGGIYEAAIEPTLREIQKTQPDYLVPCHCTGWKATSRIIETMPEKFMQSGVGTTFKF